MLTEVFSYAALTQACHFCDAPAFAYVTLCDLFPVGRAERLGTFLSCLAATEEQAPSLRALDPLGAAPFAGLRVYRATIQVWLSFPLQIPNTDLGSGGFLLPLAFQHQALFIALFCMYLNFSDTFLRTTFSCCYHFVDHDGT